MTEIDIIDIVKKVIKDSGVMQELTGKLCEKRPENSKKEDVCVFVLSSMYGQVVTAEVDVNVYIADIYDDRTQQHERNKARIRKVAPLFENVLKEYAKNGAFIQLEYQHIGKQNGSDEHVIINRIFFKHINE